MAEPFDGGTTDGPVTPPTGDGGAVPTEPPATKSAPGPIVVAMVALAAAAVSGVLLVNGVHHAIDNPNGQGPSLSVVGYRTTFSLVRFVVFTLPLTVVLLTLVIGAVGIFRYRYGPVTASGRRAGTWTRWSALLAALLVMVLAALAAVAAFRSRDDYPDSPMRLIVILAAATGLVLLAYRTLRASALRRSWRATVGSLVVACGLLALPYAAAQTGPQASYFDSGFRSTVPFTDPLFSAPLQMVCGDRSHCLVSGWVDGVPDGTDAGLVTTADGGRTWHAALVSGHLWAPWFTTMTCRGHTCWGLWSDGSLDGPFGIATVIIDVHGVGHISVQRTIPPPTRFLSPVNGSAADWTGACTSASDCIVLTTIHPAAPPDLNFPDALVASVTTDAGTHWTSSLVPLPAGSGILLGSALAGPRCGVGGTCVTEAFLPPEACGQASCDQRLAVLRSSDEGATWTASVLPFSLGPPLKALEAPVVWNCEAIPVCTFSTPLHSTYRVSTDAGATWSTPRSSGAQAVVACAPIDCARAEGYHISVSFNHGRTWEPSPFTGTETPPPWTTIAQLTCSISGRCLAVLPTVHGAHVVSIAPDGRWWDTAVPPPVVVHPRMAS